MSDADPRLPQEAPPSEAWSSLVRWRTLDREGFQRAQKSAQTWRNGLAGFVTLLLSVLVLKGSDLSETPEPFRWIAIAGCIGGTILAIWGLWLALDAEAPAESEVELATLLADHGSVAHYEQAMAKRAQDRLRFARKLVMGALALLIVGIGAWWMAPARTTVASQVQVEWATSGTSQRVCGTLLPTGDRHVVVQANSGTDPVTIPTRQIVSITQVDTCE